MTLLRDVEVDGRRSDVRFGASVGGGPDRPVMDGRGGALLPGLHDHHLHLLALAASRTSVDVRAGVAALARAPGTGWIRAVGLEGDIVATDLDVTARPVRAQHRSGAAWVLNTAALVALEVDLSSHPGVERHPDGRPTGRLFRMDDWIAARLGRTEPDLAAVGRELSRYGLTGVTDATPDLDRETVRLLRREIPQRLTLLGDPDGSGPVKIVLVDSALPGPDELADRIASLRPRAVAVHCVTSAELVVALTALEICGGRRGDRIEHAAVVPAELVARLPAVVTQPGFLADRGDRYLTDVDAVDLPHLYRYASLVAAGVPVVASSDAPYGPVDPWQVIAAARDRRTAAGRVVGPPERVTTAVALEGYLRDSPTGPTRRVAAGAPADLVLLHVPLAEALAAPHRDVVRATWIGGRRIS